MTPSMCEEAFGCINSTVELLLFFFFFTTEAHLAYVVSKRHKVLFMFSVWLESQMPIRAGHVGGRSVQNNRSVWTYASKDLHEKYVCLSVSKPARQARMRERTQTSKEISLGK
jgi:hypothetical protein